MRRARRVVSVLGLLVLSACAAKGVSEALHAPALELRADWFRGYALQGPLVFRPKAEAAGSDSVTADPLRVRCRAWFVANRPAGDRPALSERLRLISSTRGGSAVESSSRLLRGVEVASGETAAEFAKHVRELDVVAACPVADVEAALFERTTLRLYARLAHDEALAAKVSRAHAADIEADVAYVAPFDALALQVSRRAGATTIASLVVDGRVPAPRAEAPLPGAARTASTDEQAREIDCSELVVLRDAPQLDASPLILVVPATRPGMPKGSLILELRVDRDCPAEAAATCKAALEQAKAQARDASVASSATVLRRRELEVALAALELARERPALIWLSTSRGAKFAAELALIAKDGVLEDFTKSLVDAASTEKAVVMPTLADAAFAWELERASLRFVIARAQSDELEAELRSVLLERVGELGRYPGSLETVLRRTSNLKRFEATLIDENRLFLEDRDPAARVRAFDWLSQRGVAPKGFDPLADKAARKAVLDRLEAEAQETASGKAGKGGKAGNGGKSGKSGTSGKSGKHGKAGKAGNDMQRAAGDDAGKRAKALGGTGQSNAERRAQEAKK